MVNNNHNGVQKVELSSKDIRKEGEFPSSAYKLKHYEPPHVEHVSIQFRIGVLSMSPLEVPWWASEQEKIFSTLIMRGCVFFLLAVLVDLGRLVWHVAEKRKPRLCEQFLWWKPGRFEADKTFRAEQLAQATAVRTVRGQTLREELPAHALHERGGRGERGGEDRSWADLCFIFR
eukprot:gene13471-biopygen3649